ncbi:MAG: 3-hydroxyacyl-CoA dehydrogenase [Alphaproteobacteria bacterium]|nr:MAG: 3-hydroxyacyl-CoA dehydrogenase [Alphaproteobacteria bacterium]
MTDCIKVDIDADGIALWSIDVPEQSMNIFTADLIRQFDGLVAALAGDERIKGVVIASGKDSGFLAGADLRSFGDIAAPGLDAGAVFERAFTLNRIFRALETSGKPVAAAINGVAMGGGLELALACHYRVLVDDATVQIGLPEVKVGLLPGAGGTQRLPRLMGAQAALMYLVQGKTMSPQEAKGMGVVHALAPSERLVGEAKAWVKANPKAQQPWDVKGFKVPGGAHWSHPGFMQTMMGGIAMVAGATSGNMAAPKAIMSCVYEGLQLPMDRAIRIESKYFTKLIMAPQAHNMIRTLFVSKQAAEKGARRPAGVAKAPTRRLAMLGAGLMGAGIAYVSAKAGIEVVLLDRDMAAAEKGKGHVGKLVEKDVKRGKTTRADGDALLARIRPTADYNDLKGCDFVIEAVFEDRAIKADVTKKVEAVLGADTIFGSNTSTLPITGLAGNWSKPAHFIGVHFFSPVEKMPLVEIIMGKKTGAAALAKALDYVRQIRKTPIVVNDSRGFYTSRCFATYVTEGYAMIKEGVNPALIENCGVQLGMPVGPLAVGDEVAIDLSYKIMNQTRRDLGDKYVPGPADAVTEKMYEMGRYGRKNGKGFYVYPEGGKKYLWPDIAAHFGRLPDDRQPSAAAVKTRLLYRQLVECARCYAEGVLETPQDGDLGAIFGWGFAPYTGGPFSYMDTLGLETVVATLNRLARAHGPRFKPPKLLRDMAKGGKTFYGAAAKQAA